MVVTPGCVVTGMLVVVVTEADRLHLAEPRSVMSGVIVCVTPSNPEATLTMLRIPKVESVL